MNMVLACLPYLMNQNYFCLHLTGFPQDLEIMEKLENHQKSSIHRKIMEFGEKNLINHVKIMEFFK